MEQFSSDLKKYTDLQIKLRAYVGFLDTVLKDSEMATLQQIGDYVMSQHVKWHSVFDQIVQESEKAAEVMQLVS